MATALLVVPPFLKSVNGPLLGPAMLAGAGNAGGHRVAVLDLNAAWIRERVDLANHDLGPFVGDHDRPPVLREFQADFARLLATALPAPDCALACEDPALTLTYKHEAVRRAATELAAHPALGGWARRRLAEVPKEPAVVGVSVLFSGQVLAALATSLVARSLWPRTLIVFGGPHVTALREQVAADPQYGWAADAFVFGYAERTFVRLLDAVDAGASLPPEVRCAGSGSSATAVDDGSVVPDFADGRAEWPRLTLPAQTSRGCAYGRCTYCTYPAIEGVVRNMPDAHLAGVLTYAARRQAAVSLKDSLVVPSRLDHIARLIGGRAPWSACTKLNASLDRALLRRLAESSCATLEFGLETLTEEGQLRFDKRQTPALFERVAEAAVGAGIAVVVNYMTGIPGVSPQEEEHWLGWVRERVARLGVLAKVEHNTLQVERLSPMGMRPDRFGIHITRTWPWATVMAWDRGPDEA